MLDDQPESVDSHFSMNETDFTNMVSEVRDGEQMMWVGGFKDKELSEKPYNMFRRSIFFVRDVKKGDVITSDDVRVIRPGNGAHPFDYDLVVGAIANQNYERGDPVTVSL